MTDLISIGEILIDLTQTATRHHVGQYAANPGGAPANVAVAASRLGASTAFIGKVGCDQFGRNLRQTLQENGVSHLGLFETDLVPTTLAVVSVDSLGERSFSFYRQHTADILLTQEEAISMLTEPPQFLHLGSVSLTDDPSRTATLTAARHAKALGSYVSYDPNYRASLWPDEATACYWMKQPLIFTDILKVSQEEFPLLVGSSTLELGTAQLAQQGISLILVTLGEHGVFYRMGTHTGHVEGVPTSVVDTNGAGDTFFGAVLSRLSRRPNDPLNGLTISELEEILSFANRAASITCSRRGAIPAMPTLDELT